MSLLDYVTKLETEQPAGQADQPGQETGGQAASQAQETASQADHQPGGKLDDILDVLEFCRKYDLPARVVGSWVWLRFEHKPGADTRQALKSAGFRWSRRRGQWAHNCGHPARPSKQYRPWDKYQTVSVDEYLGGAR